MVTLLQNSPLTANGHAMPSREKVLIQTAFDVKYTTDIEHMLEAFDSLEVRLNILEREFSTKTAEFFNLANLMLLLTVFPAILLNCHPYWTC